MLVFTAISQASQLDRLKAQFQLQNMQYQVSSVAGTSDVDLEARSSPWRSRARQHSSSAESTERTARGSAGGGHGSAWPVLDLDAAAAIRAPLSRDWRLVEPVEVLAAAAEAAAADEADEAAASAEGASSVECLPTLVARLNALNKVIATSKDSGAV